MKDCQGRKAMGMNPNNDPPVQITCGECGHTRRCYLEEIDSSTCMIAECIERRREEEYQRRRKHSYLGQMEALRESIRAMGRAIRDAFLEDTAWIRSKFRLRDGEQDD